MASKPKVQEVVIEKMMTGRLVTNLVGTSPLIFNAMSAKARHELLLPRGRKTAAEKAQTLKHDPISEYRNSCYKRRGEGPTRLVFPASAIKCAIATAALEVPGAKKAQIGRLVWAVGDYVDIYGEPELFMSVVRSADMNKTPDVRTRAILREWCCKVDLRFVMPTMNEVAILRLLETAGLVIGLGDFRQEKGKGNYGQFQTADDADVKSLLSRGMDVQDKALESPAMYDIETEELYDWYNEERKARGK